MKYSGIKIGNQERYSQETKPNLRGAEICLSNQRGGKAAKTRNGEYIALNRLIYDMGTLGYYLAILV